MSPSRVLLLWSVVWKQCEEWVGWACYQPAYDLSRQRALVTGKNLFCRSLFQTMMYTSKTAQLFLSGEKKKKKDDKRSQENSKLLSRPKKTSWYLARKLDTELVLEHSFCTLMWADEELFGQSEWLVFLSIHLVCAMEPQINASGLVKVFSLISENILGTKQTWLTITVTTPMFIALLTREGMEPEGRVSHQST